VEEAEEQTLVQPEEQEELVVVVEAVRLDHLNVELQEQ
tara:strand:- start:139 stop:252 length:114 start_codon:yes stop_codon:yes gene_type:complete